MPFPLVFDALFESTCSACELVTDMLVVKLTGFAFRTQAEDPIRMASIFCPSA